MKDNNFVLSLFNDFLENIPKILSEIKERINKNPVEYNIIKEADIIYDEVSNTILLTSFFNITINEIKIGNYFLEYLRKNKEFDFSADILQYDLDIQKEQFEKDENFKGRFDIKFESKKDKFVLVIENKIYSQETSESQVNKYIELLKNNYKDYEMHVLYLTPYGSSANISEDNSVYYSKIIHDDIANFIEEFELKNKEILNTNKYKNVLIAMEQIKEAEKIISETTENIKMEKGIILKELKDKIFNKDITIIKEYSDIINYSKEILDTKLKIEFYKKILKNLKQIINKERLEMCITFDLDLYLDDKTDAIHPFYYYISKKGYYEVYLVIDFFDTSYGIIVEDKDNRSKYVNKLRNILKNTEFINDIKEKYNCYTKKIDINNDRPEDIAIKFIELYKLLK